MNRVASTSFRRTKRQRRSSPSVGILRVTNLSHAFAHIVALRGVSFDVQEGEILGILGPNGGGKSTLFRILATALLPSQGDALVAGQSVVTNPERVRESIGVVFQSFALDKKLTVRENLRFQGQLYSLQGEILEQRIDSLLDSFALSTRKRDLVGTLSGGLQRRVEIAKGLLHSPKLLLLDEPSTGLDPSARLNLWDFLEVCRQEERATILLTTHLAEEAERCDRIIILDRGVVVASGTPDDLKKEIGGDVLVVQSAHPELLKRKVQRTYKLPSTIVQDKLLLEVQNGPRFIPQLIKAYPTLVTAVTLRKPSLEDVFIHKTGHGLSANRPVG